MQVSFSVWVEGDVTEEEREELFSGGVFYIGWNGPLGEKLKVIDVRGEVGLG